MEDDEEIQSQHSAGSGSRSPSPPNGRITVTVAAVPPPLPPPSSSQQNTLTLALPLQQSNKPGGGGGGGGGGREDCWSEGATGVLIDAWGERYLELSRGNLKQKHWREVADIVSSREDYTKTPKTDIQCKNRIDTVKKKYKLEKAKLVGGGGPSKWIFFDKLDHLIGPTAKIPPLTISGSAAKVPVGIPVGLRSANQHHHHHQYLNQKQQVIKQNLIKNPKIRFKKRGQVETESEEDDEEVEGSPDSADSLPPPLPPAKRVRERRSELGSEKKWGSSVRELTQAILRFGEAYEKAESEKLQQVLEIEKQRMKFAKELELQRMQFFMKTQLEISQLKYKRGGGGGGGGGGSGNHHTNNNSNNNNNNNSDISN